MGIFKTSEQAFWQWFAKHEGELFDFEADRERIFGVLSKQLSRVHPDLTFEFGPKASQREFVVSAGGLQAVFPAVTSLVSAAPRFDRWRITAFRPRRNSISIVEIGDKRVDPADVKISLLTNGSIVGLQLFIPGFTEGDKTLGQIGYLMLDEALGEYDVETKVGLIEMLPIESPETYDRYPISDLASLFDELVARLTGPTLRN